jgi:hypothetical protein
VRSIYIVLSFYLYLYRNAIPPTAADNDDIEADDADVDDEFEYDGASDSEGEWESDDGSVSEFESDLDDESGEWF